LPTPKSQPILGYQPLESRETGIVDYQYRRFFKRLLLNYWDSDSSLAKIAVRIAGISSKFAVHAAGIHSARKFFCGLADLTRLDGILHLLRSSGAR
jgi:hypothetical protein